MNNNQVIKMIQSEFNFETWFNSFCKGEDIHHDNESALTDLVTDEKIVVTRHRKEQIFIINNIINRDEQGKYFVDVKLNRDDNDIMTTFMTTPSTGVNISFILDGNVLPINCGTVIVPECAMYTELLIRLTFIQEPFDIKLITSMLSIKGIRRKRTNLYK